MNLFACMLVNFCKIYCGNEGEGIFLDQPQSTRSLSDKYQPTQGWFTQKQPVTFAIVTM